MNVLQLLPPSILHLCDSNLRVMIATFIMAEMVDPSQDFSSPYHVSS